MNNNIQSSLIIDSALICLIAETYALDIDGRHGIAHWARVRENALMLADSYNANTNIIEYFSVLHDVKRLNEKFDKDHGERGAAFIQQKRHMISLDADELGLLLIACKGHNTTTFHENVTVQACWDADRLDLLRAGIEPSPDYMNLELSKSKDIIQWANQRSTENFIPDITSEWKHMIQTQCI